MVSERGLGKSFLLDAVWWTLTRRWPREINRRMTCGLPARPYDRETGVDPISSFCQEQECRVHGNLLTEGRRVACQARPSVERRARRVRPRRRIVFRVGSGSQLGSTEESLGVCIYRGRGMGRAVERGGRPVGSRVQRSGAGLVELDPGAGRECNRHGGRIAGTVSGGTGRGSRTGKADAAFRRGPVGLSLRKYQLRRFGADTPRLVGRSPGMRAGICVDVGLERASARCRAARRGSHPAGDAARPAPR